MKKHSISMFIFLISITGRSHAGVIRSSVSCDGKTDVTAAMQAEINSSVGQQLIIPAGSGVCIVSGFEVPSNSHLTINAQIRLGPNASKTVFNIKNASNIIIDGSGIIDGNRTMQKNCRGCAGVNALHGSNITVGSIASRLTIKNVVNWPVNIVKVNGAQMLNLTLLNSGNSVEFAAGTNACLASGLRISGIQDEGFAFYGGAYNCKIENSVITNSSASGVSLLNDRAQKSPSHDIIIDNVESFNNSLAGIEINTGIGGIGDHYNVQISNSRLHNNGQLPIWNAHGTNVSIKNCNTVGDALPMTKVTGHVDGLYPNGDGSSSLRGWACTLFSPTSLKVDLYLSGLNNSPRPVGVARFSAANKSEAAVAGACKSNGTAYRFSIPLTASFLQQHRGRSIYVYGLSPWGFSNNLLINSGRFAIP
jgi:hypothetical protein